MVEYLILYAIFAITTGLASIITIFHPVIQEFEITNPEDTLVTSGLLSYLVFALMAALTAPIIIIPTIFEGPNASFRKEVLNVFRGGT